MQTRAQELPENTLVAQIGDLQRQIDQLRTPQSIGISGAGTGNGQTILINDGTNDRVLIGKQVGGF